MFIIQYIVVSITIIYLALWAYIKIKYPFWNIQPVYHTYDIWRRFSSRPFFIYPYRPIRTKFFNDINVKTLPYLDTDNDKRGRLIQLLRSNYVSNDRILLTLQEKNMDAVCSGHLETPFLSYYTPSIPLGMENLPPIYASIVSYPVKMYYKSSPLDKIYSETPFYFLDLLCVYRELEKPKKNRVIRELFQTHEYQQRLFNPSVIGSLFKREIDLLDGVIPLVQYTTYVYYLNNQIFPALPAHFHCEQITQETMDLLTDFLFVQTHLDLEKSLHYELLSVTNLGNYVETLRENMTYVFCLKKGEHVYGMYFFKDAHLQYEDIEGNTLQFYGSICNTDTPSLFYLGFLHAICQIVKKFPLFKMLIFENLGHNMTIHRLWREKNTPVFDNRTAYYTFNWILPGSPLSPEKCLFI